MLHVSLILDAERIQIGNVRAIAPDNPVDRRAQPPVLPGAAVDRFDLLIQSRVLLRVALLPGNRRLDVDVREAVDDRQDVCPQLERRAGLREHVTVTSSIDDHPSENGLAAGLRLEDASTDFAVLNDWLDEQRVQAE